MRRCFFVLALFMACLPGIVYAQEGSGLKVDELVFCTAVQDRTPSGADTAFASIVENVYCFVRVSGAADTTAVTHVWYYQDREVARVELAVRASSWRTWSTKKIPPEWQGTWRVDILSPAGDVLKSGTFAVKP
jgi:hypothetical protein